MNNKGVKLPGRCTAPIRNAAKHLLLVVPFFLAQDCLAQLSSTNRQIIHPSVGGATVEANDRFGTVLTTGDFNGDGYSDLVIGVPYEAIGAEASAGAAHVLYGSANRLTTTDALLLHRNVAGIEGNATELDYFGHALAAADFNGDGWDDLVIGAPASYGGVAGHTGSVQLFRGSASGITTTGNKAFVPSDFFPIDAYVDDDLKYSRFGMSLGIGNLAPDGHTDLLIATIQSWKTHANSPSFPFEEITTIGYDTNLFVVPGLGGNVYLNTGATYQLSAGPIAGGPVSLAFGDANNSDSGDDIIVAAASAGTAVRCAYSTIAFGCTDYYVSDNGLVLIELQNSSYSPTLRGKREGEQFASAIAVGDFGLKGYDQVLIGSSHGQVGSESAGFIEVLDVPAMTQTKFSQQTAGIFGVSETADMFGAALAVGDFNGDGFDDAVIGVPEETLYNGTADEVSKAGAVHVIYGGPSGLSSGGNQLWILDDFGGGLKSFANDLLGSSLAVGDFNGDGADDLAIGAPGASPGGVTAAGLVFVLFGTKGDLIFYSGFED